LVCVQRVAFSNSTDFFAGIAGITALKNLREEGFDAIGFEKSPHIGGLWRWTADQETLSVTKRTRANLSKHRFTYSDFPWPEEPDTYPTSKQITDYLDQYAEHFNLLPYCRLSHGLENLDRSKDNRGWEVTYRDKSGKLGTELFQRVVVTTGVQGTPLLPKFDKQDKFKGRIIHSRAFKEAKPFTDQRVVVVGLSNTGGDVAVELSDVASAVFLSHRSGVHVVTRNVKKPADHMVTRRASLIMLGLNRIAPRLIARLANWTLSLKSRRELKLQPEWRFQPVTQPLSNVPPIMNDYIVPLLRAGKIHSVNGISSFGEDGHSIVVMDGTTLYDIDSVVLCTGYHFNYEGLGPEANPTNHPTPEWDIHPHSNNMPYPWLYRGVFSPKYPDSLAFIGTYRGFSVSATSNADLTATALTQIWKGNYSLPPREEMERFCEKNYRQQLRLIEPCRTNQVANPSSSEFEMWLNEAAGNGVNERLDGGWRSWKWMLSNWKLSRLLMDGIDTPFVQRLFDSPRGDKGRKKYDGALDAIMKVQESAKKPMGSI
jgi:dimethylaniline monooxygenase (N-oxide forming)